MAVTYQDGNVTITCDKCGHSQTAKEGEHNDAFMKEGWALYSNARKYKNKCRSCQPPKDRRSHDWVMEKFGHLLPITLIALLASCVPARSPYGCPKNVTKATGDTIPEWMHVSMRPKGFVIAMMALSVRDKGYCIAHLDCAGKPFPVHYKVGWCEGKEKLLQELTERKIKSDTIPWQPPSHGRLHPRGDAYEMGPPLSDSLIRMTHLSERRAK